MTETTETNEEVTEATENVVEAPEEATTDEATTDEATTDEAATDDAMTETAATETAAPEAAAPREPIVIDRPIQTVGRRKEAVVRVRLVPGTCLLYTSPSPRDS